VAHVVNAASSLGKGIMCAMSNWMDAKSGWLGASCLGQYCWRVIGLLGQWEGQFCWLGVGLVLGSLLIGFIKLQDLYHQINHSELLEGLC